MASKVQGSKGAVVEQNKKIPQQAPKNPSTNTNTSNQAISKPKPNSSIKNPPALVDNSKTI